MDSLVSVGVRTLTDGCREQLRRFPRAKVLEAKDWPLRAGKGDGMLKKFVAEHIPPNADIYISFDLDVLDPAYAPAVSHLEPGGISTRQALDFLHCLGEGQPGRAGGADRRVVMADLVELNPRHDLVLGSGQPTPADELPEGSATSDSYQRQGLGAMAAAKIAKELLGLLLLGRRSSIYEAVEAAGAAGGEVEPKLKQMLEVEKSKAVEALMAAAKKNLI